MKKLLLTAMILGLGVGGAYAQATGGPTPDSAAATGSAGGNNKEAGTNPTVPVADQLTADQQREFRSLITAEAAAPIASPGFTVAVGAEVPRSLTLRPLPARIGTAMPAWSSYQYFRLNDGRIAVVDPGSMRVVSVISG